MSFSLSGIKDNLQFTVTKENELPEKHHQHIRVDQIIAFKNEPSQKKYPNRLRRIAVWDDVNKHEIELIANHFQ